MSEQLTRSPEDGALDRFSASVAAAVDEAMAIWHWGDGQGGALVAAFDAQLAAKVGRQIHVPVAYVAYQKARIPAALRIAFHECDRYRCRQCDTHLQLSIDHIVAEVNGGLTALEKLQTLCRPCNSRKGAQ